MKLELKITESGRRLLTLGDMKKIEDILREISGVREIKPVDLGRTVLDIDASQVFAIMAWVKTGYRDVLEVKVI